MADVFLQVPHNLEAEQSVLGSMLIDPRCIPQAVAALGGEDFYLPQNRELFETIRGMCREGQTTDLVTVLERMRQAGAYDEKQSRRYVLQLMELTPTARNLEEYMGLLAQESLRRRLLALLEETTKAMWEREDPLVLCAALEGGLEQLTGKERGGALVDSTEALLQFLDYRDRVDSGAAACVKTGYKQLDETLGGGFVQEGLYILAARPGVGKTTLGLQIADRVASRGVPVLFVSLEMSLEQLSAKRVAVETGLSSHQILLGSLGEADWAQVTAASNRLSRYPIRFNRKPGAGVSNVAFMARQVKGCGLVVIDYLGLLSHEKGGSLYERVTLTSNALKRLARSLGVPILCLAQLNRAKEGRSDKSPWLSDLRDSGAIEQDADGVLLLDRPLLGKQEEPKGSDPAPLACIVAKNRHGATGRVDFNLYLNSGRIRPAYSGG